MGKFNTRQLLNNRFLNNDRSHCATYWMKNLVKQPVFGPIFYIEFFDAPLWRVYAPAFSPAFYSFLAFKFKLYSNSEYLIDLVIRIRTPVTCVCGFSWFAFPASSSQGMVIKNHPYDFASMKIDSSNALKLLISGNIAKLIFFKGNYL